MLVGQPEKADSYHAIFLFNIGAKKNQGFQNMILNGTFSDVQLLSNFFVESPS